MAGRITKAAVNGLIQKYESRVAEAGTNARTAANKEDWTEYEIWKELQSAYTMMVNDLASLYHNQL